MHALVRGLRGGSPKPLQSLSNEEGPRLALDGYCCCLLLLPSLLCGLRLVEKLGKNPLDALTCGHI
jgi:hypothetical protein